MVRRLVSFLIKCYQKLLSPLLGSNCRFYPTCSSYADQCFKEYSLVKASMMSFKRIIKCHPFHPGGYDPVHPEANHE